jgi:hypothetical protein
MTAETPPGRAVLPRRPILRPDERRAATNPAGANHDEKSSGSSNRERNRPPGPGKRKMRGLKSGAERCFLPP